MKRASLLALAAIVYGVAAWMVAPGFYDGFGPPQPYNWTCPPPQAGAENSAARIATSLRGLADVCGSGMSAAAARRLRDFFGGSTVAVGAEVGSGAASGAWSERCSAVQRRGPVRGRFGDFALSVRLGSNKA